MSENYWEPEVPEAEVRAVECLHGLARITSKELATTHFVNSGTHQNVWSTRSRVDAVLWKIAQMHIVKLMNSRLQGSIRMMTKSAVAMLQKKMGCDDMKPPKFLLRKSSHLQKPIQRVKCTKAIARHIEIRDQNPSAPTLQNLRTGLRKRQNARARCPRSSVESWPKVY